MTAVQNDEFSMEGLQMSTPRKEACKFLELPTELIQQVLEFLDRRALCEFTLASRNAYTLATPLIWREVELVDCKTIHPLPEGQQGTLLYARDREDDHDDTPLIKKLLVLARNPFVASHVHTLSHRCHLPTPGIFSELPEVSFKGRSLSDDHRTLKLLRLAIHNLINVHTLRIVFGHWNLTVGLLSGFLRQDRPFQSPLRKLWLESCSLEGLDLSLFRRPNMEGGPVQLQSMRLRRLRLEEESSSEEQTFELSRKGSINTLCNGKGGFYYTNVNFLANIPNTWIVEDSDATSNSDNEKLAAKDAALTSLNDISYGSVPGAEQLVHDNQTEAYLPTEGETYVNRPMFAMFHIVNASMSTLTSLNLDWLLWKRESPSSNPETPTGLNRLELLYYLAGFTFPNLQALQLRNAVVPSTALPMNTYLLEPEADKPDLLGFMQRHPKLKCLGWPMDRFFSPNRVSNNTAERVREVVENLGRTLQDLRVDCGYSQNGEPLTDNDVAESQARLCRRRFISEFATQLTKLKSIKMEGGIPRDEKREAIRALRRCPLEKAVLIGVSCPIGNTWGYRGEDLMRIEGGQNQYLGLLEDESFAAAMSYSAMSPFSGTVPTAFEAEYGWSGTEPPMIWSFARTHASTIKELKFCGYNGSPVLFSPTPITNHLLAPLKYFHNLEQLVLSMWLLTHFEGRARDTEIINYWLDSREPTSMAIVPVPQQPASSHALVSQPQTPAALDFSDPFFDVHETSVAIEPPNPWAELLETQFKPEALAKQVANQVGRHLSELAKARPEGVRVRASFCLGIESAGDIFDLDIRVGKGNKVLSWTGPREESEKGRRKAKLKERRWF